MEKIKIGTIFVHPDTHDVVVFLGHSNEERIYPWKIYDTSLGDYDYANADYFDMLMTLSEFEFYRNRIDNV